MCVQQRVFGCRVLSLLAAGIAARHMSTLNLGEEELLIFAMFGVDLYYLQSSSVPPIQHQPGNGKSHPNFNKRLISLFPIVFSFLNFFTISSIAREETCGVYKGGSGRDSTKRGSKPPPQCCAFLQLFALSQPIHHLPTCNDTSTRHTKHIHVRGTLQRKWVDDNLDSPS